MSYRLHVNGVDHDVHDSWLGENLLYVLRERLALLARALRAVEAEPLAQQGECGSCSVFVDGELVCSCLVLAASAIDVPIVTIEGIGAAGVDALDVDAGLLTDVQRALLECGGVQCGFCTPGFVMATHGLLERNSTPTDSEIREALSGNICRCTGYGRIIDAVVTVATARRDERSEVPS